MFNKNNNDIKKEKSGDSVHDRNKNWQLSEQGRNQMKERINEVENFSPKIASMEQLLNIGERQRKQEKEHQRTPVRSRRSQMQDWR